jgi:hypothetical protein
VFVIRCAKFTTNATTGTESADGVAVAPGGLVFAEAVVFVLREELCLGIEVWCMFLFNDDEFHLRTDVSYGRRWGPC